ncbi:MAG: helix-turn-helix domain-containing protein [Pseudomonadota bacterium]
MAHASITESPTVAISQDDRAFFQALGARIAQLRKEQNITQVQLAQTLEISQQTMNAYEMGHRRVPVSALPVLAQALAVSVEDLIGAGSAVAAKKRGPAPKLQQQMERIAKLPKPKQKFVIDMLDAVLAQNA